MRRRFQFTDANHSHADLNPGADRLGIQGFGSGFAEIGNHARRQMSAGSRNLFWKTTAKNTDVRGVIYPQAGGEMLRIERITSK